MPSVGEVAFPKHFSLPNAGDFPNFSLISSAFLQCGSAEAKNIDGCGETSGGPELSVGIALWWEGFFVSIS